ncbi:MAG: hypothetical protein HZA61_01585 [Candidatus Eisenbacteria bacterium]|uniref:Uncharacterized protein n=1 Tax=Eiseniibacteriota bacterium TaxID=2212470 RepID=A0A933SCY4_UNCEI|nr:hypothetical protein [Candidatus Eisenbacteria bacterium]
MVKPVHEPAYEGLVAALLESETNGANGLHAQIQPVSDWDWSDAAGLRFWMTPTGDVVLVNKRHEFSALGALELVGLTPRTGSTACEVLHGFGFVELWLEDEDCGVTVVHGPARFTAEQILALLHVYAGVRAHQANAHFTLAGGFAHGFESSRRAVGPSDVLRLLTEEFDDVPSRIARRGGPHTRR